MTRAACALLAAAAVLAWASAASAHIPAPEVVARAAAEASRAQGRAKPFAFAVSVRSCARAPLERGARAASEADCAAPIARGELLADPAGAARLELFHTAGFVERQLRRPSGLAASRDGKPLDDPHPLAPPLWLLQAGTGGELLARAGELGAAPAAIALGYDGARDCYVIGGVSGGPSVWIDTETYQVARVDLADGSKVRFLAWSSRGGALLPTVIEIETADLTLTLELTSAAPATPVPGAFSDAWLTAR